MVAVSAIISALEENPKPVLLIDTCAVLDIIRIPNKRNVQDLEGVNRIANVAFDSSPACVLVVGSIVPKEFSDNLEVVEKELTDFLSNLDDSVKRFEIACNAIGITFNRGYTFADMSLKDKLRYLAESMIGKAFVVDGEDRFKLLATKRSIEGKRPSRKGTVKDCILTEEYLELARQLFSRSFNYPVVFISSNTRDFCADSKWLHPDLEKEFSTANLQYCQNWRHAVSLLGI